MELVLTFPELMNIPGKVSDILTQMSLHWDTLAEMPPMNAAYILTESLATFNRLPMRFDERASWLERYQQSAQTVWDALERMFVLAPQPLKGEARSAADLALRMCQEIVSGYKRLLNDTITTAGNKLPESLVLSLILRIQQVSGRILVVSVLSYQTVPAGLWCDLHQCFAFAMRKQLHNRALQPDKPGYTLAYSYAQLVLLGLANPYSFRPEQWPILNEYIARFSVFLELYPDLPDSPSTLKIPTMQDYPPRFPLQSTPNSPISLPRGEVCIGVNLQRVVENLEQARGQLNNPDGPYAEYSLVERNQRQHLLEHLNRFWRGDWVRRHSRVPVSGEVELVLGVRAVAERLSLPAEQVVFKTNAILANHTSTGYAFRILGENPPALCIGELVYIYFENDPPLLATLRWMRTAIVGEAVEFGVQLIYGAPKPIKLRPAFDHRQGTNSPPISFQWAIQLAVEDDVPNTTRFLLASGLCQTGQLLLAQDTDTLSLWQCADCIEQTASLAIFHFVSAKPKASS
ncbi:MAG: hypothetical protein V4525_15485 [Pseudomonadota bacterium]